MANAVVDTAAVVFGSMSGSRPIDALRRFWWVVVLFAVAGGAVGGIPEPDTAADATIRWTASHTILVSSSSDVGSLFTDPLAFNQLQLFATTGQVPQRAADAIGYSGAPAALAAEVVVSADQQSGALRIATTQNTDDDAVEIADAFADELIGYLAERQDTLRENRLAANLERLAALEVSLRDAEVVADRNPDDPIARAELDALARQYGVVFEQFNVLQADDGQLVLTTLERAEAVPISESGLGAPQSRRGRAAFGTIAGLAVGAAVALLLARADRKIRTRTEAEAILGLDATAAIPRMRKLDADQIAVVTHRHDPLSDSYRSLRSLVSFADEDRTTHPDAAPVTVVVSPGPGDGKTSVTANLTAAFVEAGERTVAVNADFRRPTLTKRLLGHQPEPLDLPLREIELTSLDRLTTPGEQPGLRVMDLVSTGDHGPGELARTTARLIPRLAAVSDRVIVDTSPVGVTPEVLEFLSDADTVLVAIRLGHTSIASAKRAIDMIRVLVTGEVILVIVGEDSPGDGYYYVAEPPRRRSFRKTAAPASSDDPPSALSA